MSTNMVARKGRQAGVRKVGIVETVAQARPRRVIYEWLDGWLWGASTIVNTAGLDWSLQGLALY